MNLAAILAFYCFGLGALTPTSQSAAQPAAPAPDSSTQQNHSNSQPQAEPKQDSEPAPPPSTGSSETTKPATPAKSPHAKARHHKKTAPPNCSNAPTAIDTAVSDPAASTPSAGSGNATSTTLPPCPPPKKVVRNGGSAEPSIQLVGGGTAGQTAEQHTIDQLTAATTENLKKLEGRQLNPTQQDTVSQIKQFMDQSKTAVAAGDLERGNNLAMKARLLSDELVKP
jgi:hypothetical protein